MHIELNELRPNDRQVYYQIELCLQLGSHNMDHTDAFTEEFAT